MPSTKQKKNSHTVHAGRISIGFLHYSSYHGLYSGRYLCILLILLKAYSLISSLCFKMCFFFLLPQFLQRCTSQIKYKNYSISSLIGCSICDTDRVRCFRRYKKVSREDFFPTPGSQQMSFFLLKKKIKVKLSHF